MKSGSDGAPGSLSHDAASIEPRKRACRRMLANQRTSMA